MRPPAPRSKVDGTHFEAVEEDDRWRFIAPEHARPCRYAINGNRGRSCKKPSVAALDRGRERYRNGRQDRLRQWWHYCADHLYGRWVEGGKVFYWRLTDDEVAP